eukprot:TRINITY_DN66784_c5_g5_i1.p1 TRINITY_DN66784_c5_g5~~TRINITY_DN66784_c5_g5_i1.p1  ORF type:complete len:645 (+),score=350.53 TRINITY_DN66784_c5_g5_i1:49-1935(+)
MVTVDMPITLSKRSPVMEDAHTISRLDRNTTRDHVVITFLKECDVPTGRHDGASSDASGGDDGSSGSDSVDDDDEDEDEQESLLTYVGVGLEGLDVGTTRGGHDVVHDGFPNRLYFGQRHKRNPEWDAIEVPPENDTLSLYISYNAKQGDPFVELRPPLAVAHSALVEVELSGDVDGGPVNRRGEPMLLDVNFKCKHMGVAPVTISISLVPEGTITFTVPKRCGREHARLPRGTRVAGFYIGTRPYSRDVVKNGFTRRQYTKYRLETIDRTHKRRVVGEDVDSITFYLHHHANQRKRLLPPLRVMDPLVFSTRPVCNVWGEHDLPHELVTVFDKNKKDGNVTLEEAENLVVDGSTHTLNITFNCVWGGTTMVVVRIPILPRGEVSFAFTKKCRAVKSRGGGSRYRNDEDDELHWDNDNFSPDSDSSAASLGHYAGFINVGTTPELLANVVDNGVATVEFSVPKSDLDDQYHSFSSRQVSTTFYVNLPLITSKRQPFGVPQITQTATRTSNGLPICEPAIHGPASNGALLNPSVEGGRVTEFTIDYNCRRPGLAHMLVTIPLQPRELGRVSFHVAKVCGGSDGGRTSFALTAQVALTASLLISAAIGITYFWRRANSVPAIKYHRVSTH